MRSVAVLLLFAAAFGLAALWQAHRVRELHAEREIAARIQDGELAQKESGLVPAEWARVVIGRPSGAESLADEVEVAPAQVEQDESQPAPESAPAEVSSLIGDFEKVVEAGESLSEIARAHYGTAAHDLVRALAHYNSLADENALQAGQKLRLPPLDQLAR